MALIGTFIALSLAVTECLGTQLCGKRLSDMLDLVCDGRGFNFVQDDDLHMMNKRTARQYLVTSRSTTSVGGVVNECCHKSCSMEHLEKYCAAPANPSEYLLQPKIGTLSPEMAIKLKNPPTPPAIFTTLAPTTSTSTIPTRRPSFAFSRDSLARFFFVRPVGPRPTRTPVYK